MNMSPCRANVRSGGLRPPTLEASALIERRYNCLGLALVRTNGTLFGDSIFSGGVAERLIAPVLKTGRPKGLVSSNLTPSAPASQCGVRSRIAGLGYFLPQPRA